jgi:nitrite reductase/ring-hydroxylating ferredoxin subunit
MMTSTAQSDVVTRLIGHLTNSTTDMAPDDLMVPVSNFTSAERAALERRVLHRRPLVVGHYSELPRPGTFVTRELLGTPVILVRRADGSVGGYVNICRHRGGIVEDAAQGSRRIFACKYHGWSYESETGALQYVPHEPFFGPIERSCNGLEKLAVFERHGLLWVDLSGATSDLGDYLGPDVDRQLTEFGLDESVMLMDESFPLRLRAARPDVRAQEADGRPGRRRRRGPRRPADDLVDAPPVPELDGHVPARPRRVLDGLAGPGPRGLLGHQHQGIRARRPPR